MAKLFTSELKRPGLVPIPPNCQMGGNDENEGSGSVPALSMSAHGKALTEGHYRVTRTLQARILKLHLTTKSHRKTPSCAFAIERPIWERARIPNLPLVPAVRTDSYLSRVGLEICLRTSPDRE